MIKTLASLLLLLCLSMTINGQDDHDHNLPPTAIGPIIPQDKGYFVEPISGGIYHVTDGTYNAMFLVYDTGVVMVDAPPTIGENLLKAIAEVTEQPVTHLVYSHAHTDHIGAAALFPPGIEIVAHEETKKILELRGDPRRPIPTITFDTSYQLRIGGQVLQLDYHGQMHMDGNIFIYAPSQRVLMVVDIVYPGWVPFKNLGVAEGIPAYMKAHDITLGYGFTSLVAGHVTRLGTREDVEIAREFMFDLKRAAEEALRTVSFEESAKETGYANKWKLFDTYMDKVVDVAYDKMHTKWTGKLGGLDTYLRDNVWTMCESVNIDF